MFFQCMAALFDRTRRNIKWPLVVHTTLMFFLVTIYTAITLNLELTSNIGNREFPGVGGILPPGPTGYQDLLYPKATNIVSIVVCLLNNWLADGLLASSVFSSVAHPSDLGRSSSYIVAT